MKLARETRTTKALEACLHDMRIVNITGKKGKLNISNEYI